MDNPNISIIKDPSQPKKAFIIFARRPDPGCVKTRLIPALGPTDSARLYECMLLDVLHRTASLPVERFLFHVATPGAADYFAAVAQGAHVAEQIEGDLGIRMERAFKEVFAGGVGAAVIIGTDSPDLPIEYVTEAFRLLEGNADVVFGPAEDGGYYLAGMNRVHPELFREIPWSTSETLAATLRQAEQAGIRVALLPEWYDVDELADLSKESLLAEDCPAERTRKFLENAQMNNKL